MCARCALEQVGWVGLAVTELRERLEKMVRRRSEAGESEGEEGDGIGGDVRLRRLCRGEFTCLISKGALMWVFFSRYRSRAGISMG